VSRVRIEARLRPVRVRFQHAVGFFDDQADLLQQAVPVAQAALARGEPVGIALRPATARELVEALGGEGLILFTDRSSVLGVSAQTTAARRARELRAFAADYGTATVLSEHSSRYDGYDGSFWTELDAALNVACADIPVSLTCFYPELALHRGLIHGARRNHPLLLSGGELRHNPDHRRPAEVLSELPPPEPPILGPPDLRLAFRAWQLHEVRSTLERILLDAGYGRSRAEDVVLAVNEIATNAVEHGTLEAQLLVWIDGDGLTCEIHDGGRLVDRLPGLRTPHPGERRGRGLWVARQLCDMLHVWTDPKGTHVRVRAAR
jgi:anti-sigma regulatory factor (Ser/Thr protein kinase)